MEICTSHFKEDLTWLNKSDFPVTVVHHDGGNIGDYAFTIPNKGREASSYLKFIIERYENLPRFTAFIHGHETAYHQLGDRHMLDMIRDANTNKYEYIPLNNNWRFMNSNNHLELFSVFLRETELYKIVPSFYITDSGAQFIVSETLIKRNSKEFYQKIFDYLMKSEDDIADATCMEFIWCLIFGSTYGSDVQPDYFDPPIKHLKYWSPFPKFPSPHIVFINCKFEIDGIVNVKTQEEYDREFKNGSFYILFDKEPTDFKIEPPMFRIEGDDELDVYRVIHITNLINIDWIKELNLIKNKSSHGRD